MAIIGPVGTSSSSPLPVDLSSILSSASLNKIVGVLFTFQVHFLSSKLGITLMLFDICPKLAWTGWKWQTWKVQHQAWNLESGTTIQQDTPLGTSPDIQDTLLDTSPLDTSPLDTSPDTDSTFFRIRLRSLLYKCWIKTDEELQDRSEPRTMQINISFTIQYTFVLLDD